MTHEEILKQALEHWRECTEDPAERENRKNGKEDAKFADGDQWDPAVKTARELANRPALTFNRMEGFLHQVENEVRQNRTEIKISPVDSAVDKDTAAVDQGLVRQIQHDSRADAATTAAFEEACRTGLGAFTLSARYVGDDSFDQELVVRQIPDAINRCWFDTLTKDPDRADMRFAFEVDLLSKENFKAQFPDSESSTSNFWDNGFGNFAHDWISESGVRVANYWYIETKRRKLLQLNSGQTVFADEAGELPEGVTVVRDRMVAVKQVKCAKINGQEVLDEYEWPGKTIPVFLIVGKERYVEGLRKRKSLIYGAKDGQRLLNAYRSGEAELIGLAPKTPFIAAEGQLEGYEHLWKTANTVPYAVLPYKPLTVGGQVVPPPQRNVYEPPIQALSLGAAQVIDEMKAAVSMYDASLGARSNETSGVAIRQRQAEGDLANYHFIDNYKRALDACGRAIVEVKPYYYDTPRTIQILGEDETERVVRVNEQYVDEKGIKRLYPIADTKYNVRISTAPAYTTQRQEAMAQMSEYARAWPQLLQIAGDIIFRNSDMPGADQLAERIKKTLDPKLTSEDQQGPKIPPQVQAQMEQLAQMNEQLTQALTEATNDLNTRRLEIESRERIATLQVQAKLMETQAKIGSQEALELLRQEIAAIGARLNQLRADEPIEEPPTE